GNYCDISSTYCLFSGERNVVWYTIPITTSGNLVFAIVPNDYGNPNPYTGQSNPGYTAPTTTDYDFGVWKVAGSGTLATCATIASGTAPIIACNYNSIGVTGCYGTTAGTAPSNFTGGYGPGFNKKISATAGDVYLLAVSNFTGSTQGFTLLIGTSLLTGTASGSDAGVNYTSPTTVTWSGGAGNTDWTNPINWGSCAIPTCGINAVVAPSSVYQPTVAANETVQNLTINSGASLTINAGVTLTVCGDFTNNGTLVASPTSTILFTNPITHNLYGSLTGTNKLGNLTITSSGGTCTVKANANVDIGGNFKTSNSTSIFNTVGNYIRVAGNFTNNSAASTYSNVGTTGTLEFNGSAAQTYTPGGNLTLNNVVLNQSSVSTVTLSGNNMILGTSGNLTLTKGVVVTNALEVTVNNKTTTSVTTGSANSYINGNLRRYLNTTGSYDFPVGNSASYQRANINFTAATSIGNLLARFDTPAPAGPQGSSECSTTYNLADLNNGYWTITANANPTTGTYTTTLYPTAYSNSTGASGWTVIKNDGAAWYLSGVCAASTVSQVVRNAMNGFSKFAVAQATSPLPIELLSFTGENQGSSNLISWATASETNNAYFTIEHSDDGMTFSQVSQVSGAGNSTQEKDYSTIDYNPFSPVSYYRLKQTDYDGNFTYSDVIAIESTLKDASIGNVRPNPTKDNVAFDVSSPTNGSIEIQVVDMYGKILVDNVKTVTQGQSTITTNLQNVVPGVYLMKIIFSQNNFSAATRLITSYHKIVKY
ncbi:MAG TPA: T9SS type A sorting domain-containing protein, partial [Bacteroidia bacterium]|nr:T9SS type A sorting domain-containing protein [Bacteroidia bacterium]